MTSAKLTEHVSIPDWITELVAAANTDNNYPDLLCNEANTLRLLRRAPAPVSEQASLAIRDFTAAGNVPLAQLRSDEIAQHFCTSIGGALNVLVARLIVPGGPWPGHYGLEVAAFTARMAVMPEWFPSFDGTLSLHFAESIGLSGGFQRGQGNVLFPELLSTREAVRDQGFGIVFIDRLAQLYETRVEAVFNHKQHIIAGRHENEQREVRELAFLAHEWGHYASTVPFGFELETVDRRLAAIVGELQADLAAIRMLLSANHKLAESALQVLILDRIVREAWLRRADKQVTSIVALQLLILLERIGCLSVRNGGLNLQPQAYVAQIDTELQTTRQLEAALLVGDVQPTLAYLANDGWHRQDKRYSATLL